jgi:hypothetical protein
MRPGHPTSLPLLLTPAEILGTKYALDLCSDFVTLSAGKVSAITDLSGHSNSPSQGTASKQPSSQANVLDGHPSVRSDGSDDVLRVAGTFSGLVSGDRPYYYTVVDPRSGSASYTQDLIYYDTDGAASTVGNAQELIHAGANLLWRPNSLSGGIQCSATSADLGPQLLTLRYLAADVRMDINNVEVSIGSKVGLSTTPLWLTLFDRSGSPAVPGAWDFFRHIVANPAPTADQHKAIIAYLKRTYPTLPLTL